MDTTTVIRTQGMRKDYEGFTALRPFHLQVPKNSVFGFLGPNGAGKTTFMKLLMGLLEPDEGNAEVLGMDVDKDAIEIKMRVGYLPQELQFYERMTARQILQFSAGLYMKGPKSLIESRVEEMITQSGLRELADRRVGTFSRGEKQRLGIAQAQVHDPELLILDEPAANLDPLGRKQVFEILQGLRERSTIFFSTHILSDVERICDRVAVLHRGSLAAEGDLADLLGEEKTPAAILVVEGNRDEIGSAAVQCDRQPWVESVYREEQSGGDKEIREKWTVTVSDEATARERLLRLILGYKGVQVLEYGKQKRGLEDLFEEIVSGGRVG